MRMAVIDGSTVTNIIEAPEDFELPSFTLVPAGNASIGWTYDGETFSPPPPPPPVVPASVSMRQARLALLGAGILAQVDAAFDAMSEPDQTAARIEWEYATELRRDHPLVSALAAELNLTEQQVDDLFIAAASIA